MPCSVLSPSVEGRREALCFGSLRCRGWLQSSRAGQGIANQLVSDCTPHCSAASMPPLKILFAQNQIAEFFKRAQYPWSAVHLNNKDSLAAPQTSELVQPDAGLKMTPLHHSKNSVSVSPEHICGEECTRALSCLSRWLVHKDSVHVLGTLTYIPTAQSGTLPRYTGL